MFKSTEVERKIREINLLINMYRNLSLSRTSDHFFLLSLQQLSWDLLGTKSISSTHVQNFWKVNKLWRQKRHAEITSCISSWIQTSSLGRLQKKSLKHNCCLYAASALQRGVRKPPVDNIHSPQNYFQTNCWRVVPMLLKSIGTTLEQFVWT